MPRLPPCRDAGLCRGCRLERRGKLGAKGEAGEPRKQAMLHPAPSIKDRFPRHPTPCPRVFLRWLERRPSTQAFPPPKGGIFILLQVCPVNRNAFLLELLGNSPPRSLADYNFSLGKKPKKLSSLKAADFSLTGYFWKSALFYQITFQQECFDQLNFASKR